MAGGSSYAEKDKHVVYFDYDEFVAVKALDPNMADARLCGMNKSCMKLWRNGDMLVPEKEMVVRADIDGDGFQDIGVALEKDRPDSDQLDYFELCAHHDPKNGWRLLETVPIKTSHAIIETAWDEKQKSITVDTGERYLVSESTVTMMSDGKMLGGIHHRAGEAEILLTYLKWDAKTNKFDVKHGVIKQ